MAVILDDASFNRLVTMHHYAEAQISDTPAANSPPTDKELDAIMHFNILISGRVCASEEDQDPRDGAERIADERMRQLNEHGWTEQHDNTHDKGELGYAAAVYALPPWEREVETVREMWPWEVEGHGPDPTPFKFSEREQPDSVKLRIRELEKAGAFCAAEIDRLERIETR